MEVVYWLCSPYLFIQPGLNRKPNNLFSSTSSILLYVLRRLTVAYYWLAYKQRPSYWSIREVTVARFLCTGTYLLQFHRDRRTFLVSHITTCRVPGILGTRAYRNANIVQEHDKKRFAKFAFLWRNRLALAV